MITHKLFTLLEYSILSFPNFNAGKQHVTPKCVRDVVHHKQQTRKQKSHIQRNFAPDIKLEKKKKETRIRECVIVRSQTHFIS
ncbi:CLUMA_CG005948, isoform A [Clunio marinus]|uniref:CLUMA_CG005948, isoform A n=1 Tax=Clunio marinus TaxID=568069 RepID=A0A1J1I1U5_9DIPT|nr:CLUMA_CG005948, isoform A [Clunio marinus]